MSFESYLLIECHLAKLTVAAYLSDINYFVKKARNEVPTKDDVISFLNELNKQEFTKSSIARKMSALRIYLTFLKIKKNKQVPDLNNLFSSNLSLKLPKLITQADLNKLMSFSFGVHKYAKRNELILGLMYYCGCRVSEVAQLKKANVFKDHIIIQGKGEKQRLVPICKEIQLKLDRFLNCKTSHNQSEFLFVGKNNNSITRQTISNILLEAKKACAIKSRLTPHTLRHMFASFLLEKRNGYPGSTNFTWPCIDKNNTSLYSFR